MTPCIIVVVRIRVIKNHAVLLCRPSFLKNRLIRPSSTHHACPPPLRTMPSNCHIALTYALWPFVALVYYQIGLHQVQTLPMRRRRRPSWANPKQGWKMCCWWSLHRKHRPIMLPLPAAILEIDRAAAFIVILLLLPIQALDCPVSIGDLKV